MWDVYGAYLCSHVCTLYILWNYLHCGLVTPVLCVGGWVHIPACDHVSLYFSSNYILWAHYVRPRGEASGTLVSLHIGNGNDP